MATFKTAEATKQDGGLLADRVSNRVATGDLRYLEFTYTFTGTEAATGDSIEIGDVPVNVEVLPELSSVAFEASMGGSDLALPVIGDSADADRYSATSIAINSSTAGRVAVTPAVATGVISRHKTTQATQRLIATFTRTNAATAGKKVKFFIAYRLA
jgi:hypothetical protein